LGAGVLGRSGTPVASRLMNESDLLAVVGASFSDHTGIASYKRARTAVMVGAGAGRRCPPARARGAFRRERSRIEPRWRRRAGVLPGREGMGRSARQARPARRADGVRHVARRPPEKAPCPGRSGTMIR
jgi:hypothetical protein